MTVMSTDAYIQLSYIRYYCNLIYYYLYKVTLIYYTS
jgi:hypothetical protein